jgi:hypothetical protein
MRRTVELACLLLCFGCGGSRAAREEQQLARFPKGQIVQDCGSLGSVDDRERPANLRLLAPVLGRGVCVAREDLPLKGGGFVSPRWGVWTYEYVQTTQKTAADGQLLTCFEDIRSGSLGLEAQGEYEDNQHAGEWTYWHPNGAMRARGPFRGGKMSGPWSFWKADGKPDPELSGVYADDVRVAASAR